MSTTGLVMTVTDELLAELEEMAAGATEGPWKYETDEDSCYGAVFVKPDTEHYSPPICRIDHDVTAEFVAATDPTTIMALTAELRRLRAENADLAKDAARLQFVIDEEITISKMNGTGRPMVYQCHWHDCRQTEWYSSIVEAIDTAMFDTAMAAQ